MKKFLEIDSHTLFQRYQETSISWNFCDKGCFKVTDGASSWFRLKMKETTHNVDKIYTKLAK